MIVFILSILISLLGVLNLFGINSSLAYRHFFFLIIAIVLFFIVNRFKTIVLSFISQIFYFILILNLYLVFFGDRIKGARRWINIFGFQFQPSEIMIIVFIFFLAKLFSERYLEFNDFLIFLKSVLVLFLSFLAVYLQPDLGTALEFIFIYFVILIFAPIEKRYFIYLFLLFFVLLPLVWFNLKPYQKARIESFIKKSSNLQISDYNVKQAEITVGSGGFWGQGLGKASQVRLAFLPEKHTDFAFASFISQTGFLGGIILLIFYIILIAIFLINFYSTFFSREKNYFISLGVIGFLAHIIYRVFVNIGMNLGLLPIVGVPLVLFSLGGSSLISFFFGLALLIEKEDTKI